MSTTTPRPTAQPAPSATPHAGPSAVLLAGFAVPWSCNEHGAPTSTALIRAAQVLVHLSSSCSTRSTRDAPLDTQLQKDGMYIVSLPYGIEWHVAPTNGQMKLMALNVQRTCPIVPLVLTVRTGTQLPSAQPTSTPASDPPAPTPAQPPRRPTSSESKEAKRAKEEKELTLVLTDSTTAQSLVEQLGEPSRKGGGDQPRLGPAAWLEWCVSLYLPPSPLALREQQRPSWIQARIHVGLRGPHARGAGKWEKHAGGQSTWDDVWLERANIP